MKALLSLMFVSLFSLTSFAEAPTVGFKHGNNLEYQRLVGNVQYFCKDSLGSPYTRRWTCIADLVSPGTHDYVVSSTPIDADKVTLKATRADGSTKSKSVGFNSDKSTSSTRVNLWIRTLTQSPLLKDGANKIDVEFKKGKNVVATTNFTSNVTFNGETQCRFVSAYSYNDSYCTNQDSGCNYYFYLTNDCKN